MSWQGDDQERAKAACGEFYERHSEYLYRRLAKHIPSIGEHAVEDLVMDAFKRAFEKAVTYVPLKDADPIAGRRNVRAWLGKIAHNLFQDYLRRPDARLKLVREWEPYEQKLVADSDLSSGSDDELLHLALATLAPDERRVVDMTMQHLAPGEKHQRLPNGVAEELAKSLDTTTDNVRQLRRRAYQKIREYFASARKTAEPRSVS